MRGERQIRRKWPAIYTFSGKGANGENIKQYRLFGGQTSSDVWWLNKFGDLF